MEAERREVEFARRLSVSDKGSRDRALKKLKTWLHARSQPTGGNGYNQLLRCRKDLFLSIAATLRYFDSFAIPTADFGVDEMMKLWRGLHYCMWMSDKPLVQVQHVHKVACTCISKKCLLHCRPVYMFRSSTSTVVEKVNTPVLWASLLSEHCALADVRNCGYFAPAFQHAYG